MIDILEGKNGKFILSWNRDPEEFDFEFTVEDDEVFFRIYQYPTPDRQLGLRSLVYSYCGVRQEVCEAFYKTFERLYEDKETDEFESNWQKPFPLEEFKKFRLLIRDK